MSSAANDQAQDEVKQDMSSASLSSKIKPPAALTDEERKTRVEELARELKELEEELEDEEAETIVQDRIRLLHDYNDVKDAAQALIGRIAVMEGTTVKELYPRFGLELDD